MKKLAFLFNVYVLFCAFSLSGLAESKDVPGELQNAVGKRYMLLIPIYHRGSMVFPGDPTNMDQEMGLYFKEGMMKREAPARDMYKVINENQSVIITKVEVKAGEAEVEMKSESGRGGKITFHYKDPAALLDMWQEVFDQKASYSFELLTGGLEISDDLVSVSLVPGVNGIGIKIKNNTDEPIKIDWSSASIVDPDGNAQGVVHSATKLANKDDYQKPTTLPPSAAVSDILFPSNSVEWSENGWMFIRLFPTAAKDATALDGKQISIFLPIQIAGKPDHNLNLKLVMHVSH